MNCTRRSFFGAAGAVAAGLAFNETAALSAQETPKAREPKFELGVASYSFRNFNVDQLINWCKKAEIKKVTLKEMHLSLKSTDEECAAMAKKFKDVNYHMIVGGGILWGEAYDYAMCILEEMQWIRTKSIHAAEFFHGTLELLEKDVPMILLYGEDETEPLMDRVKAFASNITDDINIFNTADVELPFTDPLFRKIVSPLVVYAITERLSCHIERVRNHPLTTRRYYRQFDY